MNQTKSSNQSMCLYKNMKESEIKNIITKIKYGEELIHKIEHTIQTTNIQERTLREFKGMIFIKNIEIECNKNLIKEIEEMADCI